MTVRIQQFIKMKMIPCFSLYWKLASLNFSMGAVRWRSSCKPAPLLTVAPVRALIDEQTSIKGYFLPPHCPVTVCSQMQSEDGDLWEAFANYYTNSDGTVNLAKDHSVGGSYLGCEPMGLFWALQPAPGGREGLRLRKNDVAHPYTVHISLLEGHISPSEVHNIELAVVKNERWYMAPGVRRIDIRHNGLVGTLFLPPGPGPFPAILDLWGMGGGLVEYRSALLASRGYASLALAYIGHKELPGPHNRINVSNSYFKSAFQLLQDHHQVCADRIGIFGLSFGVYVTLQLATQSDIKHLISCLICINGPVGSTSNLSTLDGQTEVLERKQKYWKYDGQGYVSFKDAFLPDNFFSDYIVKIENITCPLMYIVGEDDMSMPSIENANLIEESLRAAGKSKLFTRLSYPGAGHLIEPPYMPTSRTSFWSIKPQKLITVWGGHLIPHAAAQEDAWKKILDFLERNLRG